MKEFSHEIDNTLLDLKEPDSEAKECIIKIRLGDVIGYIHKKYDSNPVLIQASMRKFFDYIGYKDNGELKITDLGTLVTNLIFYIKRNDEELTKASDPKWELNRHLQENLAIVGIMNCNTLQTFRSGFASIMPPQKHWKYEVNLYDLNMKITDPRGKVMGTVSVGLDSGKVNESISMSNSSSRSVGTDDL